MKNKFAVTFTLVALALSAFAFSGSNHQIDLCPLRGTPACPAYPACCR